MQEILARPQEQWAQRSDISRHRWRTGIDPCGQKVFPLELAPTVPGLSHSQPASESPEEWWPEVKGQVHMAYRAFPLALARLTVEEFAARFEKMLPLATQCFLDNFEARIAHPRLPIVRRRTIRTTILLERLFGEERGKTQVILHAFGELPVPKPIYASLIPASQSWQRVAINEFERRQIED